MERPHNTLASYTTPLSNMIDFTCGDYEAALVEISGQTYLYNIEPRDGANMVIKHVNDDATGEETIIVPLEPGRYGGVLDIVEALNDSLASCAPNLKIHVTRNHDLMTAVDDYDYRDLFENPQKYMLYLSHAYTTIPASLSIDRVTRIFFMGPLGLVFSNFVANRDPKMLPDGYAQFTVFLSQIKPFHTSPRFNTELSKPLYLYTDLIEHQYMGNGMSKLLRNFVIPEFRETTRFPIAFHKEFLHPHYKAVEPQQIRSVNINIRTVTGELAPFARGELVVKVHFRAKNGSSTLF